MPDHNILVIGALGQIGTVLTQRLQKIYGEQHVIASDVHQAGIGFEGIFERLDATDLPALHALVERYKITQVYHLAAVLSAKGEENPLWTWNLNMKTLFNVLEAGRIHKLDKVFFPSSIAVFGDLAPQHSTPQTAYLNPSTVYGISKSAGENWAQYYHMRYGLDVRSLRYPGIIGHQSLPGGGTTDYAVDIFHKAVQGEAFTCFLQADTLLPMLYMEDAIEATLQLMQAPADRIQLRTSYNIGGVSFSPAQLTAAIRQHYPLFRVHYQPDYRQAIADKWPDSIDDSQAHKDWGWKAKYDLEGMTQDMIFHLKRQYQFADTVH